MVEPAEMAAFIGRHNDDVRLILSLVDPKPPKPRKPRKNKKPPSSSSDAGAGPSSAGPLDDGPIEVVTSPGRPSSAQSPCLAQLPSPLPIVEEPDGFRSPQPIVEEPPDVRSPLRITELPVETELPTEETSSVTIEEMTPEPEAPPVELSSVTILEEQEPAPPSEAARGPTPIDVVTTSPEAVVADASQGPTEPTLVEPSATPSTSVTAEASTSTTGVPELQEPTAPVHVPTLFPPPLPPPDYEQPTLYPPLPRRLPQVITVEDSDGSLPRAPSSVILLDESIDPPSESSGCAPQMEEDPSEPFDIVVISAEAAGFAVSTGPVSLGSADLGCSTSRAAPALADEPVIATPITESSPTSEETTIAPDESTTPEAPPPSTDPLGPAQAAPAIPQQQPLASPVHSEPRDSVIIFDSPASPDPEPAESSEDASAAEESEASPSVEPASPTKTPEAEPPPKRKRGRPPKSARARSSPPGDLMAPVSPPPLPDASPSAGKDPFSPPRPAAELNISVGAYEEANKVPPPPSSPHPPPPPPKKPEPRRKKWKLKRMAEEDALAAIKTLVVPPKKRKNENQRQSKEEEVAFARDMAAKIKAEMARDSGTALDPLSVRRELEKRRKKRLALPSDVFSTAENEPHEEPLTPKMKETKSSQAAAKARTDPTKVKKRAFDNGVQFMDSSWLGEKAKYLKRMSGGPYRSPVQPPSSAVLPLPSRPRPRRPSPRPAPRILAKPHSPMGKQTSVIRPSSIQRANELQQRAARAGSPPKSPKAGGGAVRSSDEDDHATLCRPMKAWRRYEQTTARALPPVTSLLAAPPDFIRWPSGDESRIPRPPKPSDDRRRVWGQLNDDCLSDGDDPKSLRLEPARPQPAHAPPYHSPVMPPSSVAMRQS